MEYPKKYALEFNCAKPQKKWFQIAKINLNNDRKYDLIAYPVENCIQGNNITNFFVFRGLENNKFSLVLKVGRASLSILKKMKNSFNHTKREKEGKIMSKNKVWFITGMSSGFGRALAEEVLAKGDRVVATARKPEVLQDLIEKYPDTARAVKLDVTNMEDAKNSVREAVKEFGRIDVLVNNAGYALVGAIEEASTDDIEHGSDRL